MVTISLDVNRKSLAPSYTQLVVELLILLYNFLERLGTTSFSEESWTVVPSEILTVNRQVLSTFFFLIRRRNETNINGTTTQSLKGSRPNVCSNLLVNLTCASWSFALPTSIAYYCFIAGSSKA